MAESISYIKLGNQEHPIDAVTVNGLSFTSEDKTRWDNKQDALTFDSIPTENSDNPVKSGGVYDMIVDNEYVVSTALNDLNDRMLDVEESMSSVLVSESDPLFSASPAASITAANISSWNAKQDALTFDSIPTENSDNLVKSGPLYTVLTNTELVVATALNDLNERILSANSSISDVYDEIDRALTAVLTYRGTVGSNGDVSVLPSTHGVGDVYVVSVAGTYAGQACEVGDYIICKTSGTSASDGDWNVINGENQVSNSSASLAEPGSSVTIATIDGTNITISTPASWTGVSKNGTLTGVTFNGVSASVSNGVASISAPIGVEVIDVGNINFSNASLPSGTFARANQAIKDGKTVILRTNDGEYFNDWHTFSGSEDGSISFFNENYDEFVYLYDDDTTDTNTDYAFVRNRNLVFDSIPTENSDNLVKSGDLYTVIVDNEEVTAAALNDLNDRMETMTSTLTSMSNDIADGFGEVYDAISSISSSFVFDSIPTENSENLVKSGDLYTVITQNEFVAAAALNDLNDRLTVATSSISSLESSISSLESNISTMSSVLVFDSIPTENSDNLVKSGDIYDVLVSNERVVATAFNDLNDRLTVAASSISSLENDVYDSFEQVNSDISYLAGVVQTAEEVTATALNDLNARISSAVTEVFFNGTNVSISYGSVSISETDPVFSASPAASITAANISSWNAKQDALVFDSIPTENSNNLVKSGVLYSVITDNELVISTALNDLNDRMSDLEENSGSGITGVMFNGVAASISNGVASISASIPAAVTSTTVAGWGFLTSESDPVFSSSVAASISAADISNWNSKTSNTGTLTGVTFNGTSASISNGVASISVSIPAEVTEATVSSWGFTKNTGTLTSHASHKLTTTNGTASAVTQGTEITYVESLTGTTTATSGDLSVTATRKKVTIPTAVTESIVSGWGFTKNTGTLTSESDPVFAASAAASITVADISNWNSKTSNTGTITGISMNGSSKGTSGNVDLGNVVTAVSFNGTSVSPSGGVVTIAESDPVFAASVAASITASDISNWNSKANNGWYVQIGTLGNTLDGVPLTIGGGPVCLTQGAPLYVYNDAFSKIVSCNTSDWSGIVRTSASGRNENDTIIPSYVTLQDDLDLIYNKVPDATSSNIGSILVASYDSVNGYHWEASTSFNYSTDYGFPGSLGTTYLGTGGIRRNDRSSWDWIQTGTTSSSLRTLQSDLDAIKGLPAVTSSDVDQTFGGKILVTAYDSTIGYYWEKTSNLTLYNNGQIAVHGSDGTTYLNSSGVYKTDRSSWNWIKTGTGGTNRSLQDDLDAIRQLPAVTSSDNGKVLQVSNGAWTLVTPVSIYNGSSTPNNSQGTDGDIYLQTS